MNKPRLDDLLQKIGMTEPMKPLLESDSGAYFRLENAVDECLGSYKGVDQIAVQAGYTPKWSLKPFKNGRTTVGGKSFYGFHRLTTKKLQHRISWFRRYYGINDVVRTQKEIASEENLTSTAIGNGIDFVESLLAQRHKHDIWYGTFEDLPRHV